MKLELHNLYTIQGIDRFVLLRPTMFAGILVRPQQFKRHHAPVSRL
jgi:hypothetical protein